MNIRSALMDRIRRFATHRGSPRVVEKRTYVFILVPFDFRGNGHARKPNVAQDLIGNGSRGGAVWTDTLSTLTDPDSTDVSSAAKTTVERDLNGEPELSYNLMWTWFLPNRLWPPKKSTSNLENFFRRGVKGFNANKTRRNN
jgi:hypothetical protein